MSRPVTVTEVTHPSGRADGVLVAHGADLTGRNIVGVMSDDLCFGACEWCKALKIRIQSRTGEPFPT